MSAYIYPSHEQVVIAWLKTLTGVPTDKIATSLPADNASWAPSGFIQVTTVGGSPAVHVPVFNPVVQVDCWANNVDSQRPPWGKASSLAERIMWATYAVTQPGRFDLGADVHQPRLMSVYPLSEPRRIVSDPANFARVQFDLTVRWTLELEVA